MKHFITCVAAGKRVAEVFAHKVKLFLNKNIVAIRDMQDDNVEGCDFDGVEMRWIQADIGEDMKALLSEIGQTTGEKCLVPELVRGGLEVKGVQPNKSLHRNDLHDLRCPALPYGMWAGEKKHKKGHEEYSEYSRNKHGPLRRMFEPEWMPKSAEPMALEFVLECWDNHGKYRPFASIAFTDFPELKHRIIAYGNENDLDLPDWNSVPVGKEADSFTCGDLIFQKNVWHVPLEKLVDIARIVIIGEAPRFYKNGSCTVEIQKERYQYLCDHAVAHISLEDYELVDEESWKNHPVFVLLQQEAVRLLSR